MLLLAACGDADREQADASNVVVPNDEARAACVTSVLARAAAIDLAALDSIVPDEEVEGEDAAAQVRQQAARAAYEYAYEYFQFASLAATSAAYEDSAANYAQSAADSARYARAAVEYGIRPPEPESVQENAAAEFRREFTALWNDADHPCNWDVAG